METCSATITLARNATSQNKMLFIEIIVMPMRPEGAEDMDEDALAALVTRDCMIGVTVPKV